MPESTLTVKGQTTLPKDVRRALALQPGDKLRYLILDGGEVRIVRSRPVADLSGVLKDAVRRPVSLEEMEAAIARGATEP
jgi:AbrB family looped-hinge helix DNA binding protein